MPLRTREVKRNPATKGLSQGQVLKQRLAYVQWLKSQNENKMRETLDVTRQMQESDLMQQLSYDAGAEKAAFMQSVIEDELQKPLEVTQEFLEAHEQRKATEATRARQHQASLLRGTSYIASVEKRRDETRVRNERFRHQMDSIRSLQPPDPDAMAPSLRGTEQQEGFGTC